MNILDHFRSLFARMFHRSEIDHDMSEELRSHIQHHAEDLQRSGLSRADAERRARIEFGSHARVQEECREAAGTAFFETLLQDLRFSARVLRKSPGFTIAAVLTLALAIGANAVVFAVLNALILHPLNVPRPESLYTVERESNHSPQQSYPDYRDLRDRNRSFDGLAAWTMTQAGLDTGTNPSRVWPAIVSGNYFDVLGIRPYLGRFFHAADERGTNSAPYVVLTYAFWHTHFGDDRRVLGRTVRINKYPFTIIGVAPRDFHGSLLIFYADFYAPMANHEQVAGWSALEDRGNRSIFMVLGHLKHGVTTSQAIGDLNSIGSELGKIHPKEDSQMTFTLARPGLLGDFFGRPVGVFLTALMVLAGLILLASCANLGSLFAARAADRSKEVALRLALGSSRRRILRGLLTEAVLISLLGGAVGLIGSVVLLHGLSAWQPLPKYPFHMTVDPDAAVYAIALVLALVSGILFGLVPVRQVLRTDPYEIVKSGSRTTGGRQVTAREISLALQIAICAMLVTSSVVAVRGLVRSLNSTFGFQPRNAMVMEAVLNMAGYRGDAVPVMQKRLIHGMEAIPGVTAVGLTNCPPLTNPSWSGTNIFRDGVTDLRQSNAEAAPLAFSISPGYFRAAETTLLAGRTITWHDDEKAAHVAVINREFARKIFGSVANAIGGHFKMSDGKRVEVVGVVEDGKYKTLTEDSELAMFVPILQLPSSDTWLIVRSNRDGQRLTAAMQGTLRSLDAGLPFDIQTWEQEMDFALLPSHIATVALSVLGAMGVLLSITGIFGMAAYSVSRRLRELGIRMALGAQRKEVLQAALGRAFKLLAFGSTAGLVLGMLASRVLASVVYGASPRDPLVFAGVILAMAVLGLVATWIPAQRALSVNPLALLREE